MEDIQFHLFTIITTYTHIANMPKNKGKGGKNRRRGKNDIGDKRELVLKDEGQGTFFFLPFLLLFSKIAWPQRL